MSYTIGHLARLTGLNPRTIRYYEAMGLLPHPPRSPSGYRRYGWQDLRRLELVRQARRLGFTLREVKALLDEAEHQDCNRFQEKMLALLGPKLAEVEQRLAELQALYQRLKDLHHHLARGLAKEAQADHPSLECVGCRCWGQTIPERR